MNNQSHDHVNMGSKILTVFSLTLVGGVLGGAATGGWALVMIFLGLEVSPPLLATLCGGLVGALTALVITLMAVNHRST
jgi:hypothetical protein